MSTRSRIDLDQVDSKKTLETSANFNRWIRFPLINGFVRVVVISKGDMKISLSPQARSRAEMLVISIGYLDNKRSAIGTSENPYTIEKDTPNILSKSHNEFWIIWLNGEVFVLKAGETKAFISMKYTQFPIQYVGFSTPNGYGVWYLKEAEQIKTNSSNNFIYHGIRNGYLEFAYKGRSDAHIALLFMGGQNSPPVAEVSLGINGNSTSSIRIDNNDYNQVIEKTPQLLSADRFTIFCMSWKNGTLTVRKDNPDGPVIIQCRDVAVDFVPFYFAVRSGRGVKGEWIFGVNYAKTIVDDRTEDMNPQDKT